MLDTMAHTVKSCFSTSTLRRKESQLDSEYGYSCDVNGMRSAYLGTAKKSIAVRTVSDIQ